MRNGDHKNNKNNQIKVNVAKNESTTNVDGPKKLAEEANALRVTLNFLSDRIDKLALNMEKAQLQEYVNLMHKPWQLIVRNFFAGLSRGIGIALGFTFFAATIVYILQILGALNLPIVGHYIADIVRIVQRQLQIKSF
jgi:hypothetical protein